MTGKAFELGAVFLLSLFLLLGVQNAQAASLQAPLTLQELLDLKALGFGEAEIRAEIDRTGTRLVLDRDQHAKLVQAGFGPELIQHITRPTGPSAPAPDAGLPLEPRQQIAVAYGAPAAVVAQATTWTQLGAEAVFLASRLAGGQRLVTTGTLTQLAAGTLQFDYAPTPTDQLRVVMKDGRSGEYHVSRFEGDLTGDAQGLLIGAHDVALRVVVAGELDLSLTSKRVRNGPVSYECAVDTGVRGTFIYERRLTEVEVRATGTAYFESGFGGTESRTDLVTVGTIRVGAMELRLDERWTANMITGVRERASGIGREPDDASSYVRAVNTTWTLGAQSGAIRAGTVRTSFKNGRPATGDDSFWKASGAVVLDERIVGELKIVPALNELRLVATTEPEPVRLETWALNFVR